MSVASGLYQAAQAQLLIIDIQPRLFPALHNGQQMLRKASILAKVCSQLSIPISATEHNSAGLGRSLDEVAQYMDHCFEKETFSALANIKCREHLTEIASLDNRQQLIVIGAEAHVCVLQSALQAKDGGFEVAVVWDAVASRCVVDMDVARQRLVDNGCRLVTTEMLIFEWLGSYRHPLFKSILAQLK